MPALIKDGIEIKIVAEGNEIDLIDLTMSVKTKQDVEIITSILNHLLWKIQAQENEATFGNL